MESMNESILTLILLAPLAGAILVALLPDRGKLPAWIALLTTLVSFGLTGTDSSLRSTALGLTALPSRITLASTA